MSSHYVFKSTLPPPHVLLACLHPLLELEEKGRWRRRISALNVSWSYRYPGVFNTSGVWQRPLEHQEKAGHKSMVATVFNLYFKKRNYYENSLSDTSMFKQYLLQPWYAGYSFVSDLSLMEMWPWRFTSTAHAHVVRCVTWRGWLETSTQCTVPFICRPFAPCRRGTARIESNLFLIKRIWINIDITVMNRTTILYYFCDCRGVEA